MEVDIADSGGPDSPVNKPDGGISGRGRGGNVLYVEINPIVVLWKERK